MFRTSWKSLLGRKVRLLMSALAIVLGVAFVSGSLIFTDMMSGAFDGILKGTVADVNVQPQGQSETFNAVLQRQLSSADVAKVRGVEGVASANGTLTSFDAYPFGKNGKVIGAQGAPAIATNWYDAPAADGQPGLTVVEGRPPQSDHEVMVDPRTLTKGDYAIGDTIKFATSGAQATVEGKIVGTAVWGSTRSTGGASYIVLTDRQAQKLFAGGKDAYFGVWISAEPGVDQSTLASRVRQVVPAGFEVVTGEQSAEQAEEGMASSLSFLTTFLLVFAGIALLVGSFLIVNTFSILVAQRSRELALLRALGATKAQVRRSVLFEALVVGLIGATLGLVVGIGIAKAIQAMFAQFGLDMSGAPLVVAPRTILVSYLVGVIITMLAAYWPARKAASVPPVAAMSGDMATGKEGLGRRFALGLALTLAGIAALLAGLFLDVDNGMWFVGAGAVAMVLGVAAISPVLGAPVIWLLGRLYSAIFGQVGRLAELNAQRNPRRTAATASALMIGLAVVTAMATIGATVKVNTADQFRKGMRSDYIASNLTGMPFSPAIADHMATVPGVSGVHRMRYTPAKVNGQEDYISAMDASSFDKIIEQRMESGSLADYRGEAMIVDDEMARERGWTVGDTVPITIVTTTTQVKVAGIYSVPSKAGMRGLFVPLELPARAGMPAADNLVSIDRADNADPATVEAALQKTVADLPMVSVTDQEEYIKAQSSSIDQLLAMIYGLLGLAIVIAILGIINTLALSVIERTREVGLLRAIGLTRGQQSLMIVLESVAIALLGSALGIGLGVALGTALQRAASEDGLEILAIPWDQVLAFLVLAVIVGILAAVWPAVRAARFNVLRAIMTE